MSNQTSRNKFSYYFARDTIQDEIDQLQETAAVRAPNQTEFAITRWDDPGTGTPIPDNAGATLNSEVFIDDSWNQYGNASLSIEPEAAKPITGKSTLWVNSSDSNRLYFNDTAVTSSSGGAGDVVGPASATNRALVRYDGTTGKLIQDSPNTLLDVSGNLTVNTLSASAVNGVLDVCGKAGTFLTDSITTWTNDDRVKGSSVFINNNDDISGVGSVSLKTEATNPGGNNTLWHDGTDTFVGSTNITSGGGGNVTGSGIGVQTREIPIYSDSTGLNIETSFTQLFEEYKTGDFTTGISGDIINVPCEFLRIGNIVTIGFLSISSGFLNGEAELESPTGFVPLDFRPNSIRMQSFVPKTSSDNYDSDVLGTVTVENSGRIKIYRDIGGPETWSTSTGGWVGFAISFMRI
jgi:hypothetical protein